MPNPYFAGWGGYCATVSGPVCVVTMSGPQSVTATFGTLAPDLATVFLSVRPGSLTTFNVLFVTGVDPAPLSGRPLAGPDACGSIVSAAGGVVSPTVCTYTFVPGATVTFEVTSTNGAPASSIVWPLGGCPPTSGASPFIARCTITLPTGTSGTEISVTTRF